MADRRRGIQLVGTEHLKRKIRAKIDEARKVMAKASKAGSKIFEEEAKKKVVAGPPHPTRRTGRLARAVRSRVRKRRKFYILTRVGSGAGTGAAHAAPVEAGHVLVIRGRKTARKVKPYRFMGPAYEATKDAVQRRVRDILSEIAR